jgi:hypothetical protein
VREFDLTRHYVCGLCAIPSRAGKKRPLAEPLPAAA